MQECNAAGRKCFHSVVMCAAILLALLDSALSSQIIFDRPKLGPTSGSISSKFRLSSVVTVDWKPLRNCDVEDENAWRSAVLLRARDATPTVQVNISITSKKLQCDFFCSQSNGMATSGKLSSKKDSLGEGISELMSPDIWLPVVWNHPEMGRFALVSKIFDFLFQNQKKILIFDSFFLHRRKSINICMKEQEDFFQR